MYVLNYECPKITILCIIINLKTDQRYNYFNIKVQGNEKWI